MYLASISGAMTDYALDNQDDLLEGVALAMEATTQKLVGDLRTEFDRHTITDIFWLDLCYNIRPNNRGTLLLSQGFVDSTQTMTFTAAATWNDLTNIGPTDY